VVQIPVIEVERHWILPEDPERVGCTERDLLPGPVGVAQQRENLWWRQARIVDGGKSDRPAGGRVRVPRDPFAKEDGVERTAALHVLEKLKPALGRGYLAPDAAR